MIYRARNSGDGAASQWSLGSKKDCVFLEMATQRTKKTTDGNASFDWDNKLRFKLGEHDLGEILAVLVGMKKGVGPLKGDGQTGQHKGLFHSNKNGNAILYFGRDKSGTLRIHLSVKKNDEEQKN